MTHNKMWRNSKTSTVSFKDYDKVSEKFFKTVADEICPEKIHSVSNQFWKHLHFKIWRQNTEKKQHWSNLKAFKENSDVEKNFKGGTHRRNTNNSTDELELEQTV